MDAAPINQQRAMILLGNGFEKTINLFLQSKDAVTKQRKDDKNKDAIERKEKIHDIDYKIKQLKDEFIQQIEPLKEQISEITRRRKELEERKKKITQGKVSQRDINTLIKNCNRLIKEDSIIRNQVQSDNPTNDEEQNIEKEEKGLEIRSVQRQIKELQQKKANQEKQIHREIPEKLNRFKEHIKRLNEEKQNLKKEHEKAIKELQLQKNEIRREYDKKK